MNKLNTLYERVMTERWSDSKKIAKAFAKDNAKNADDNDLDDWLDMYAGDKGIRQGISQWDLEDLVAELKKLGFSRITGRGVRTESVWKENVNAREIEQVFLKHVDDPGYDVYANVRVSGKDVQVGTNWVDADRRESKKAHEDAVKELSRKYKISGHRIEFDEHASVTSRFTIASAESQTTVNNPAPKTKLSKVHERVVKENIPAFIKELDSAVYDLRRATATYRTPDSMTGDSHVLKIRKLIDEIDKEGTALARRYL